MFRINQPANHAIIRTLACVAIGVASLGVFTSAAHADDDDDRRRHRDPVVIVHRGHTDNLPVVEYGRGRGGDGGRGHAHGRDCDCNGCHSSRGWAQQDYDMGVKAGRCEGFDEGYADGLKGRRFDDCVSKDFCGASKPFRDGYHWAFTRAYARGFAQGQCERPCDRPSRGHGRSGWSIGIRW